MSPNRSGDSDRIDPAVWKIAAVAAGGAFMSQIDATVVNVSLSSLANDLHSTLGAIQWVTSGYLLALALTLPLNGWIVDRVGAKAVYVGCFAAFTVSSALCGLAWSAGSLIGFRILQGMCGGLLAPMAQMMVARAAGKHMAQVIGVSALPVLLAPLLGPVLAGAILQFASWRWLFLVNLPVGVLAVALAVMFLPNDKGEKVPRRLDLVGLVLLSPGLVMFLYGADHLRERLGILSVLAALVMFFLFWRWAVRKGDGALIDLRLLKDKAFSASITTMFMANGMNFAGQMLIPIFLIKECGRSPSATGLLMAPLGVGMMCIFPWNGTLTKRFGAEAGGGDRLPGRPVRNLDVPLSGAARPGDMGADPGPIPARRRLGRRRHSGDQLRLRRLAAQGHSHGHRRHEHCSASGGPDADHRLRHLPRLAVGHGDGPRQPAGRVHRVVRLAVRPAGDPVRRHLEAVLDPTREGGNGYGGRPRAGRRRLMARLLPPPGKSARR